MSEDRVELVRSRVRDVPDFPKPGIVFKDITPILADPVAFGACLELLEARYASDAFDIIVAIESRGFIFGAALAARMGKGFVPVRKPGKLPAATYQVEYELEYGSDAVEVHQDGITEGARALLVDDLIATGGTAWATAELVRKVGGSVVGAAFVIDLRFLGGAERLAPIETYSILHY